MKDKHRRNQGVWGGSRGFTFVELLVVIALVMTLAGLVVGWALSARKANKVRATQAAMSNLLLVADTVKNASPIFPDHRLANFFYVQPHDTVHAIPAWGGTHYRRMSSGEFLAFLATLVPSSNTMIASLGIDHLPGTSVPASWGVPQDGGGVLVDVFEQDPGNAGALDKNAASTSFSLVSPTGGWRMRAPVDAWGNQLAYRLYTHRDDLNQPDSDAAPLATGGTYRIREDILQDEQATRDRYVAMGVAVDGATATTTTVEYVRPAVPSYANPQWLSAGPDGLWGSTTLSSFGKAGGFVDLDVSNTAPKYTRNAQADKGAARDDQAKDNVYSQEMGR